MERAFGGRDSWRDRRQRKAWDVNTRVHSLTPPSWHPRARGAARVRGLQLASRSLIINVELADIRQFTTVVFAAALPTIAGWRGGGQTERAMQLVALTPKLHPASNHARHRSRWSRSLLVQHHHCSHHPPKLKNMEDDCRQVTTVKIAVHITYLYEASEENNRQTSLHVESSIFLRESPQRQALVNDAGAAATAPCLQNTSHGGRPGAVDNNRAWTCRSSTTKCVVFVRCNQAILPCAENMSLLPPPPPTHLRPLARPHREATQLTPPGPQPPPGLPL